MSLLKTTRKEGLDKFYTIPSIVDKCINDIQSKYDFNNFDLIIEPSAGNGSFLQKYHLRLKKLE